MKKYILFIFLALLSFSATHAQIEWTLSEDGTLTISGTCMPDYEYRNSNSHYAMDFTCTTPWFSQRDEIKKVVIEDGVTSIGNYAFFCYWSLTSITIPNSVTCIGNNAFGGCHNLISITIPNSVKSIGEGAFGGCNNLTSITIPNSVKSIGTEAFSACDSFTSITIPNSVKSIGDAAFSECSGLTSIIFEGSTPPMFGRKVFEEVNKSIPIYVPANSIEAYKKVLKRYFKKSSIQALQR